LYLNIAPWKAFDTSDHVRNWHFMVVKVINQT